MRLSGQRLIGMRPGGMRPTGMRPNGMRLKGCGSRERGLKECGPTACNRWYHGVEGTLVVPLISLSVCSSCHWFVWEGGSHDSVPDMPPGTDCPYPIRILAFFEMIRRITLWYGFEATYWKTIYELRIVKQNSFIVETSSPFRKISEKREISSPVEHDWSGVGLIRLSRHVKYPVKLRFWFFAVGCRFFSHNVAIFLVNCIAIWIAWTFSRYIDA